MKTYQTMPHGLLIQVTNNLIYLYWYFYDQIKLVQNIKIRGN